MKTVILVVFIIILVTYAIVVSYIATVFTAPQNAPVTFDKDKIAPNGENISFVTTDKVTLKGWLFKNKGNKVIFFVHGAGKINRINEPYNGAAIAKFIYEKGYSVLMFDLRGTGESQVTRQSFGQNEKYDVIGAFKYLQSLGYKKENIGVISDSLGAISTIMGIDKLAGIGGIVADSPAVRVEPIVSRILVHDKHIPTFFHSSVFLFARLLYGVNVYKINPIDTIGEGKDIPILFLHGGKDDLIPPVNTEELLSMVNHGQRVVFPLGTHVETFRTDPVLYEKVVLEFFSKKLQ